MEETKARVQKEAEQREEEHKQHLNKMEEHLAQVPSAQQIQDQRNQRELEVQREELQRKNKSIQEQLARQEELRVAKERLSFQTIDVHQFFDRDGEVEHLFGDAAAQDEFVDGVICSQTQAFGPFPTDPSDVQMASRW